MTLAWPSIQGVRVLPTLNMQDFVINLENFIEAYKVEKEEMYKVFIYSLSDSVNAFLDLLLK